MYSDFQGESAQSEHEGCSKSDLMTEKKVCFNKQSDTRKGHVKNAGLNMSSPKAE